MKKKLFYITIILLLSSSKKINASNQITKDTIFVCLNINKNVEIKLKTDLLNSFDSLISSFNSKSNLTFINDSSSNKKLIKLNMGEIKYVNNKRRIYTALLDGTMIYLNFLLFPSIPIILPFYLMPATVSKIKISYSEDLKSKKEITKIWVNPNGTFQEKQKTKFKKRFKKVIMKYFLKISKKKIIK